MLATSPPSSLALQLRLVCGESRFSEIVMSYGSMLLQDTVGLLRAVIAVTEVTGYHNLRMNVIALLP
jgi:hypothetical protein